MKKLIKKMSIILLIPCILMIVSVGCTKKNDTELTTVRLNEVVRSIFYAPMYVAISEGFFKEEGINIELSTGQGADKTMQQVLSKSADIGFCGPEQVIYIYNQDREDQPKIFAQLTQKDGSFLVARSEIQNFSWDKVKGSTIIGGRPAGMPEMNLEYVLRQNKIIPNKDVTLITNIAFTATAGAFKSGTGDYVALFEPTASMLEVEGTGKIVASIGESAGNLPYTCFFATESYINANKDIIQGFTSAIVKGQDYVKGMPSATIANAIQSFFPGTDLALIEKVVDNYKKIQAFAESPVLKEEDMQRLIKIIESYDSSLIQNKPNFSDIVTNDFAQKAIK